MTCRLTIVSPSTQFLGTGALSYFPLPNILYYNLFNNSIPPRLALPLPTLPKILHANRLCWLLTTCLLAFSIFFLPDSLTPSLCPYLTRYPFFLLFSDPTSSRYLCFDILAPHTSLVEIGTEKQVHNQKTAWRAENQWPFKGWDYWRPHPHGWASLHGLKQSTWYLLSREFWRNRRCSCFCFGGSRLHFFSSFHNSLGSTFLLLSVMLWLD